MVLITFFYTKLLFMPINVNPGGTGSTWFTPNTTAAMFKGKAGDTPDISSKIHNVELKFNAEFEYAGKRIPPCWTVILNLKDETINEDFKVQFTIGHGITSDLLNKLKGYRKKKGCLKGQSIYLKLWRKSPTDAARILAWEDDTCQERINWFYEFDQEAKHLVGVPSARRTGEFDQEGKEKLDWTESNIFWIGVSQELASSILGWDYEIPHVPQERAAAVIDRLRDTALKAGISIADMWDTRLGPLTALALPNHVQFASAEAIVAEKAHRPLSYRYPFKVPTARPVQQSPEIPPMEQNMPSMESFDVPDIPDFDDLPF